MSVAALRRTGLFGALGDAELGSLADRLHGRSYARGEVVFSRGSPGDGLYVVESARVDMVVSSSDGREVIHASFGPGGFFGELALLDGEPRSTDAVVAEPGTLLLLERADFARHLLTNPALALRLLEVVSRKLRATSRHAEDFAFLDVPARLARVLLDLARAGGESNAEGVRIGARLTRSELAGMVGTSRESVSKWLGHYARQGLIRLDGRSITLLAPEALGQRIY